MKLKPILKICFVICMLALPAMAVGNATSPKDIIGDPIIIFNSLPDATRNAITMITGIMFLGCLICLVYGVLAALGKTSIGSTSSDAKMRSEGVTSLLVIVGVVLLALVALGFVFWWFTPGNI